MTAESKPGRQDLYAINQLSLQDHRARLANAIKQGDEAEAIVLHQKVNLLAIAGVLIHIDGRLQTNNIRMTGELIDTESDYRKLDVEELSDVALTYVQAELDLMILIDQIVGAALGVAPYDDSSLLYGEAG